MKKSIFFLFFPALLLASCNTTSRKEGSRVITVSIPPFEYFVKAIADTDFVVNVMLPPGADHHSWEPLPRQITALAGSEAFIINGKLGFEYAWMERFKEVNPGMKISDMSEGITLIQAIEEGHESHHHDNEGVDPHYWLSPKEALKIAAKTRDLVSGLNPEATQRYNERYENLVATIDSIDRIVTDILKEAPVRTFMIFHPALGYLARDYDLEQISFEDEGKDASPARVKELTDLTASRGIRIIFIQAEYDIKGAKLLAEETGVVLISINPMNSDWESAVMEIARAIGDRK